MSIFDVAAKAPKTVFDTTAQQVSETETRIEQKSITSGRPFLPHANPFNIRAFRDNFPDSEGFTFNCHFYVDVYIPITGFSKEDNQLTNSTTIQEQANLSMLCDSASLPGRSLNTTQFRAYGQPYTMAQSVWADSALQLSFITPRGLNVRDLMYGWQSEAVSYRTGDVGYYKEYVSDILVHKFDTSGLLEASYRFKDCFPVVIDAEILNWANVGQILKTNVTFSYRQWIDRAITPLEETREPSGFENQREKTIFQKLLEDIRKNPLNVQSGLGAVQGII